MTDTLRFDASVADFVPGAAFLLVALIITVAAMVRKSRRDSGRPLFPIALLVALLAWSLSPCFALGIVLLCVFILWRYPMWKTYRLFERGDPLGPMLAMVSGVAVVASLPLLVRPHLNYDVLSYHLELAHLRLGQTGHYTHFYYNLLPDLGYWLSTPFLSDRGATFDDPGVRLLLMACWIAGGLLCGRIVGQLGGRPRLRWLAVALYLWHPMGWGALLNAQNDLVVAMFALGATSEVLRSIHRPEFRTALNAGVMTGAACAIKFSAVGIVAIPLLIGLITAFGWRYRGRAVSKGWRPVLAFLSGCYVLFAFFTHAGRLLSPRLLFPFMGESEVWTSGQAAFVVDQHLQLGIGDPAYWTGLFAKLDIFAYSLPLDGLGLPLDLGVVFLLALLAGLFHARARWVVFVAALGYGAWRTVGLAPDRFAYPLVGLIIVAGSLSFRAPRLPHALRVTMGVILGLAMAWNAYVVWPRIQAGWDPEIWDRNASMPETLLARAREAEGTTLVLFDARTRWFPPDQINHTVWDSPPWADQLKAASSVEDFLQSLDGVTQVIVNEGELARLVAFYGGLDVDWRANPPGITGDRGTYRAVLEAYPPHRFASLAEKDFDILEEFLALSHRQALLVYPRGGEATLWLSPIPQVPHRP